VIDQWQAIHVLQIVIAFVLLQRLIRLGMIPLHERHPDHPRTGLDERALLETFVDLVGRLGHGEVGRAVVLLTTDLRNEDALTVDADLDLVRELEAGQVADDVAQQLDAEFVLRVLREVVLEQQAAAGAKRKPFDVILL
jgi:hypothetical protein